MDIASARVRSERIHERVHPSGSASAELDNLSALAQLIEELRETVEIYSDAKLVADLIRPKNAGGREYALRPAEPECHRIKKEPYRQPGWTIGTSVSEPTRSKKVVPNMLVGAF